MTRFVIHITKNSFAFNDVSNYITVSLKNTNLHSLNKIIFKRWWMIEYELKIRFETRTIHET